MSNFFNSFLQQLGTGDQIKDYQHAARLFVDGLYRLSPKYQNLYHVFIDLNTEINTQISGISREAQIESGMLAKSVTLPKFTVQTKVLNAYNRKNINQERINYDPVTINFHDDSANIVRELWYAYYSYYFRDSDHSLPSYFQEHKYAKRQIQSWGFSPKFEQNLNFISSIRIYSLHQKSFSSYILINPMIKNFSHGQHTAGEYAPLEHAMTIEYEAVQYEKGAVSNNTVLGFSEIHYDNSASPLTPIGGGTRSVLGPGGLVDSASDVVSNLQNGNFIGAALGGARSLSNFKNADLRSVIAGEAQSVLTGQLRGQNPTSKYFFPTASSLKDGLTKAVNSIPGAASNALTSVRNINVGSLLNSSGQNLPNSNQGRPSNTGFFDQF